MADRMLRLNEVKERLGVGHSFIYDGMKAGTFPKSIKLGENTVRWRESDINAWLDERARATSEAA
jgi:prophage regulatory protein